MKGYILITLVFLLISCGSPKFYNEIKSTYSSYDTLVAKYGENAVRESSIDRNRLVMRRLKGCLKNSNHIIYYFSPSTRKWQSKEFSGVVYDVNKDKYYYFSNYNTWPRRILVDTNYKYPNDNYYKFVIDNYQNGKINYLKKLGETNISGIRTEEVIYEIDLSSNRINKHTFRNFLFMNGKPTRDVSN